MDETFESGPGCFDAVEPMGELAFPEAPGDDSALAQRVTELQTMVNSLEGASSDRTGRALGVIGVVVGLAGLGAGRLRSGEATGLAIRRG